MIRLLYTFVRLLQLPYKNIEHINSLRLFKFKRLLNHSKNNVPFYSSRYSNVELNDIKSLDDIRLLPIVTPIELRSQRIEDITAKNIKKGDLFLNSTSGTSGMPIKFYNTNGEIMMRQVKLIRFLYSYGWKPWWKGVIIWRETETSNTVLQRLINKRRILLSIDLPLEKQAHQILSIKPQIIHGMVDSLELLADWMLEHRMEYRDANLIISSGATIYPNTSEKLQDAFGGHVIDAYSAADSGGFMGFKCPYCHLNYFEDDSFIFEILDENYDPVGSGETGRAVITVLDQFATPIIRYDIGDYIKTLKHRVNCKIRFTHYISVDGREADVLVLPNGMKLINQHVVPVRKIEEIKQYQLVQKKNGEFVFKYVLKSDVDSEIMKKLVLERVSLLRNAKVSFVKCNSIPLEPSGKFKMLKKL